MATWIVAALLAAAPAAARKQPQAIPPSAIRAHMRFLADDLLEGREAGTRGYDLAAAYVASQFERIGLAPAGDTEGSYMQQVPLRRAWPTAGQLTLLRGSTSTELLAGEDFAAQANAAEAEAEIEAPLVYVGFGLSVKERGIDDYAGLDVAGKLVVLASGGPASWHSDERAHFASLERKAEMAAQRGALGMLAFVRPSDEQRAPWHRVVAGMARGKTLWLEKDGATRRAPALNLAAALSSRAARLVFEGAPIAFDDVMKAAEEDRPKGFRLAVRARLRVSSRHEDVRSANVVGLLQGADPQLASEAVVFTAHLDHLGARAGEGDSIYNGAFDNASGVAALIEAARLAERGARPRRSLLFVATTAEELGLLGADYFVHYPPRRPMANVNVDMFLALYPPADLVAFGAEHSSLDAAVRRAAASLGFELSPDPFPRQGVFTRSDQYAFVRKGVPALMLACGFASRDASVDGGKRMNDWLASVYHTPQDDMSQKIDFDALARIALVDLRIGVAVADAQDAPTWNAGDLFGRLFGPAR